MMATLYDISQDYLAVIEGGFVYDEETGEVIFSSDDIDQVKERLEDKLEAVGCYIKEQRAKSKAIREEENALADRRRVIDRKADRLEDYVLQSMEAVGMNKVDTPRVSLSTRNSSRVEVTDEEALRACAPMCFTPQPDKVDKKMLRKIMAEGGTVDGAELVDSPYIVLK